MNIVHIAPNSPYNDYWGYQDNLLPKYQRKLGHEVTIVTTNTMHKDGVIVKTSEGRYTLNDGVEVIRKEKTKYYSRIYTNLKGYIPVYDILKEKKADYVFFHGLISSSIFDVIKYKKIVNNNCIIIQDNHMDYNIGYKSVTLKEKIIRLYYRIINKKSIKYVEKVYGVTPWRKKYAEDYFSIPTSKTDVLIMGADDEKIDFLNRKEKRNKIRATFNISDDDFLIVTGGKIDKKKKTEILLNACKNKKNVKVLLFGEILEDVKEEIFLLINSNSNIYYIGWINADKVYDYFMAADLVFFPGQHSVLWEQACASKVPCVFEKWEGMEHVNNEGNSILLEEINENSISRLIDSLLYTDKYYLMKSKAESGLTDIYLYSNIAEKSLLICKGK